MNPDIIKAKCLLLDAKLTAIKLSMNTEIAKWEADLLGRNTDKYMERLGAMRDCLNAFVGEAQTMIGDMNNG